jgi:hypothetical protein
MSSSFVIGEVVRWDLQNIELFSKVFMKVVDLSCWNRLYRFGLLRLVSSGGWLVPLEDSGVAVALSDCS